MAWECRVGGKAMLVEDLDVGSVEKIRAECNIDSWLTMLAAPATSLTAGPALVRICASKLGVAPPDTFTLKSLLAHFEWVDDDLPTAFNDNGSPTPGGVNSTPESSSSSTPRSVSPRGKSAKTSPSETSNS